MSESEKITSLFDHDKAGKISPMRKVISPSIFFLAMFLILVASLFGIFTLNTQLNKDFKSSTLYSPANGPLTSAPTILSLEIAQPLNDTLTFESSTIVSGNTSPNVTVLISANDSNTVLQSQSDGSFSTVINLEEGINQITVAAFNQTGEEKQVQRTIFYSEEKI